MNLSVHLADGRVVRVHVEVIRDVGPFGIRARRRATLDEGDLVSPEVLRAKLAQITNAAASDDAVEARLPDTLVDRFLIRLGVTGPPPDPIDVDLAAHG